MMKKIKCSNEHMIKVLEGFEIDASDPECVKEFELWKCSNCKYEYPVSLGNGYDDRLDAEVFVCDECGKSHKMNHTGKW